MTNSNPIRTIQLVLRLVVLANILVAGPVWTATVEVLYAPEDAPLDRLVGLYSQATRYIYAAVYGLTSPKAVEALVAAKKRGVDVRLVTDRERTEDAKQRSALHTLRFAGVPIKINQHDGLMHLKQVVIDDAVNVSGSMNHTTSGNHYNDERLDVVRDQAATMKAREKFLSMWNDHQRFREWTED
jgi:phosphatidylserine/phosphatidylglycerophosphate/cardiolipin synthase-like enzyme